MHAGLCVDALSHRRPDEKPPMRIATKSCRIFAGTALVSFCLTLDGAFAQSVNERSDGIASDSFASAEDRTSPIDSAALGDLIFDADFEGQRNGGTSCATANVLTGGLTYSGDTNATTNWMGSFGPLLSPSNDVVYTFVAGSDVEGSITPTTSNYAFAIYLIETCVDSGGEPQPIGATATPGRGIDLAASGVISGHTYYLAITGAASGGAGANGTVNFTTPPSLAMRP